MMRLCTPFEFLDLFPPGGSVAFVGNAPAVLTREAGAFIDGHDVVVRFNECALNGFDRQLGRKTDILVTNPYVENRVRPPADDLPVKIVLVLAPQTRRGNLQVFENWVGGHRVMFTYSPDLVGVPDSAHRAGLTTGTYAVQLLPKILLPKAVTLTGFTMFAEPDQSHYWKPGDCASRPHHDFETEAAIFCRLVNSLKAPVGVSEDVLSVYRRSGVPVARHVRPLSLSVSAASGCSTAP